MSDLNHLEIKNKVIQRAFQGALNARTDLTTHRRGDTNGSHVMRACTICDGHIPFDGEQFVAIDDLKAKRAEHFHQDRTNDPRDLEGNVKRLSHKHHTQNHFVDVKDSWSEKMILSPRSHGTNPADKSIKKRLGCCAE